MIEAILFDMGGVYLRGNASTFLRNARSVLGIGGAVTAGGVVFNPEFNRGNTDAETAFRQLFETPINESKMEQIKEFWTNNWKPDPEMVSLAERLKDRYVLAVLSNSDKLNSDNYKKKGVYAPFKHRILSHEVGFLKPEHQIYKIALIGIGVPASSCLFLDDQEACAEGARKAGMQAEVVNSYSQTIDALLKHGVNAR